MTLKGIPILFTIGAVAIGCNQAGQANSIDSIRNETMKKYDDASWHYDGDFPKELPDQAGATHMGMFVAWAWSEGLAGEAYADDAKELLKRTRTPGEYFFNELDEKFTDDLLNEEGNRFASEYYSFKNEASFLTDYEEVLGQDVETLYHVPDTWQSFDRLKPVFGKRLTDWRNRPKKGSSS